MRWHPSTRQTFKALKPTINGAVEVQQLLKSFHWLVLEADYLILKGRFGLCLPILLQILETNTDPLLTFLGWDVLNLLLDRALATEVEQFAPCLAATGLDAGCPFVLLRLFDLNLHLDQQFNNGRSRTVRVAMTSSTMTVTYHIPYHIDPSHRTSLTATRRCYTTTWDVSQQRPSVQPS